MTKRDERQMQLLMNACRNIFQPFDIIEIHRLMNCVVDSYNKMKEERDMFISDVNKDDSHINQTDDLYTSTVSTYNIVLTDKRNLLMKLNDLQMEICSDPHMIHESKNIEYILNETDIEE